jgi:O-antigen ligase
MTNAPSRRYAHLPIWGPAASVLLALAWLIPNSTNPWVAFHKDFWAGLVFVLVGLVLVLRGWRARRTFRADPIACVVAALALFCLLQWAVGIQYFFGHAALGATYLMAAAMAVVLGRAWEAEQPGAVAGWLFPAFLLGAIGTAGLMLKQWLGVSGYEVYTHLLVGEPRPYGNMLQPNNAATLLLLGTLGVFWFRARGLFGDASTVFCAGFLVFALVLTQSRIGYLAFGVLVGLGMVFGPKNLGPTTRRTILLLALWFILVLALLPVLNGWVEQGVTLMSRSRGEVRFKLWTALGLATLQHPLLGLGFFPGFQAQVVAADLGHPIPGYFAWAHNGFLDIALWFGLPAAAALLAVFALGVNRFRHALHRPDGILCAAAVLALGLHGLVELPLAYAYFLLPFALLLGGLSEQVQWSAVRIHARAVAAMFAVLATSLLVIGRDYLEIESSIYSWRFKISNVGLHHDLDLPQTLLLNQYRAYVIGVRMAPRDLDAQSLRDFERSVEQEPSPLALQAVVLAHVERGNLEEARRWISVARLISEPPQRKALAMSWQSRAADDPKYALVQWPE